MLYESRKRYTKIAIAKDFFRRLNLPRKSSDICSIKNPEIKTLVIDSIKIKLNTEPHNVKYVQ